MVINPSDAAAHIAASQPETDMRILSFVLAFSFTVVAPGFNATAESNLPGVGAFTYSGPEMTTTTMAHLTLTARGKKLPSSTQGNAHDVASNAARG